MKTHLIRSSIKVISTVLLVVSFSLSNAFADSEDEKPYNEIIKALVEKALLRHETDTIKQAQQVEAVKDTASVQQKSAAASYNILFQVIYRKSFSEIFGEK